MSAATEDVNLLKVCTDFVVYDVPSRCVSIQFREIVHCYVIFFFSFDRPYQFDRVSNVCEQANGELFAGCVYLLGFDSVCSVMYRVCALFSLYCARMSGIKCTSTIV